uniref:Uncharacterized protein n=1 Tax=Pseudomonas fluorescens (strain SBW25) TaxID=216595 RepID=A0A0G4E464_PSEFS|nr:hypothetical protein [Pseudomonas fluorescens]CEK41964.1 hypothetical protein PQBR57_0011 [Pseudomonas fluorescens SBW25]
MTGILVNIGLFLAAVLAVSFNPRAERAAGDRAGLIQQAVFVALVSDLFLFSLNETIRETGVLYGLAFSLIPLAAGAVVLSCMRSPKL